MYMNFLFISENSRKLYVVNVANAVDCNFPPEALMNTVSSYEAAYWLERISYNFLICYRFCLGHMKMPLTFALISIDKIFLIDQFMYQK